MESRRSHSFLEGIGETFSWKADDPIHFLKGLDTSFKGCNRSGSSRKKCKKVLEYVRSVSIEGSKLNLVVVDIF